MSWRVFALEDDYENGSINLLEDIEPSLLYPAHLYTLAESSNQDHLDLVDTFIQVYYLVQ